MRMRSASNAGRAMAATSNSNGGSTPVQSRTGSSFASSSSQPSFATPVSKFSYYPSPALNHSHSFTASTNSPSNQSGSASSLNPPADMSHVLSPIASRVRERDADAIALYKQRNRSGSAGTQTSDSKSTTNGVSTLPTINGSNTHLPLDHSRING